MTARYRAGMDDPLPPLTVDVIDGLKAAGLTQSDVARLYGVTRAAVSAVVRRHGGKQTPRQIARGIAWPWDVPRKYGGQRVYRYLREHLAWVAEHDTRHRFPKSEFAIHNAGHQIQESEVRNQNSRIGNLESGFTTPDSPLAITRSAHSRSAQSLSTHTTPTVTPKPMSWRQLLDLRSFYERMTDKVVEFDPELPPSEGVSVGGFAYRDRSPADGDLLIRVNAHTNLNDASREWWRMPEVLPEPVARYK